MYKHGLRFSSKYIIYAVALHSSQQASCIRIKTLRLNDLLTGIKLLYLSTEPDS